VAVIKVSFGNRFTLLYDTNIRENEANDTIRTFTVLIAEQKTGSRDEAAACFFIWLFMRLTLA
jgi:hypothetical protein